MGPAVAKINDQPEYQPDGEIQPIFSFNLTHHIQTTQQAKQWNHRQIFKETHHSDKNRKQNKDPTRNFMCKVLEPIMIEMRFR